MKLIGIFLLGLYVGSCFGFIVGGVFGIEKGMEINEDNYI